MRRALKTAADGLALVLVLPAFVLYWLGARLLGLGRAFPGWSQAFSLVPGLTGVFLRRAFYRLALRRCGADCCLGFGVIFSDPTAEVGRGVYAGPFCCLGAVTLEEALRLGVEFRVRPLSMTLLTAMLGLLPAALSTAIGSQSQRPLAIVVVGGMLATLVCMNFMPVLYSFYGHREPPAEAASMAH